MSQFVFNVPTVAHDLNREESIIQIATTLQYMDDMCNQMFDTITNRIQFTRNNISKINKRVDLIDLKISKIKGSKKAIQICSSSKYPVNDNSELLHNDKINEKLVSSKLNQL
jgi:hypothetical protein